MKKAAAAAAAVDGLSESFTDKQFTFESLEAATATFSPSFSSFVVQGKKGQLKVNIWWRHLAATAATSYHFLPYFLFYFRLLGVTTTGVQPTETDEEEKEVE